jgi:predicted  nucleic acid-binding Zn-ribbon protein
MTFMTIHDQVPLAQQPQNDLWMFQIRREHAVLHEKNRNLENTIEHLDLVREEYATKFKALQQQIHTILEKIKDLEANVTQPACKKPLIALEQRVLVLEERANSLRSPTVEIKGISLGSPRDDFTGA